jgi:hypothetical protein
LYRRNRVTARCHDAWFSTQDWERGCKICFPHFAIKVFETHHREAHSLQLVEVFGQVLNIRRTSIFVCKIHPDFMRRMIDRAIQLNIGLLRKTIRSMQNCISLDKVEVINKEFWSG